MSKPKIKTCPTCRGTGKKSVDFDESECNYNYRPMVCDTCKGKRTVAQVKEANDE